MASTSNAALLLGLVGCGIYGYSVYHIFFDMDAKVGKLAELLPPPLRVYGQFKFLTIQCLLIQLLSSILHVLGHFISPLRKPRDLVFTALAYPVGSIVVYTFWAVWHLMGRHLIFPVELDELYPNWLNHSTHTIIAPLNILLCLVLHRRYSRNGALLTIAYMLSYTVFLHLIKYQTGHFVYRYLEVLSDAQRVAYFVGSGAVSYIMYKSGQVLTSFSCCGSGGDQRSAKSGARKQKQK